MAKPTLNIFLCNLWVVGKTENSTKTTELCRKIDKKATGCLTLKDWKQKK